MTWLFKHQRALLMLWVASLRPRWSGLAAFQQRQGASHRQVHLHHHRHHHPDHHPAARSLPLPLPLSIRHMTPNQRPGGAQTY